MTFIRNLRPAVSGRKMEFTLLHLLLLSAAFPLSNGRSADLFMKPTQPAALGLYSPQDNVEILDVSNFKARLYEQPYAWYIEFYNSWCGHCQHFAPVWKDFASRVHGWNSIVKIGAIDCAQEQNTGICRDFEILGYPMMRFFSVNFKEAPGMFGEVLDRGITAQQLTDIIIKKLHSEKEAGRGNFNWPMFGFQNITTLANIWTNEPTSTDVIFLICEHHDSLIGSEIQLDLMNIKNVKVLSIHNQSAIVTFLNPETQPAVFSVDRSLKTILVSLKNFKERIVQDMFNFMTMNNIKVSKIETTILPEGEKPRILNDIDPLIQKMVGNTVFQSDLEMTLRYTLIHEIASIKTIEGKSLTALKGYLHVLCKHFPSKSNTEAFLLDLNDQVSEIKNNLSGERLHDIIKKLETKHEPVYSTNLQWLGCRGSADNYRGFTCGLWTLFHTMTVNESSEESNKRKVLPAMLEYVKHFFGCTECSKHFQDMVTQYPFNSDQVRWLWWAHNRVNFRLAGDKNQDPHYPKKQFPYQKDCPQCWEDGKWVEPNVISYLKTMYKIDNISMMAAQLKLSMNNSPELNGMILTILSVYCGASLVLIVKMFCGKKMYKKKPYFFSKH